jgi:hypothetical protein
LGCWRDLPEVLEETALIYCAKLIEGDLTGFPRKVTVLMPVKLPS